MLFCCGESVLPFAHSFGCLWQEEPQILLNYIARKQVKKEEKSLYFEINIITVYLKKTDLKYNRIAIRDV